MSEYDFGLFYDLTDDNGEDMMFETIEEAQQAGKEFSRDYAVQDVIVYHSPRLNKYWIRFGLVSFVRSEKETTYGT